MRRIVRLMRLVAGAGSTLHLLAAVPEPMARWTFETDARDTVGELHGALNGGARIAGGRLILDGNFSYVSTVTLPRDLTEKTLTALVRVGPLDQRGGGVMSLEMFNGLFYDAVVFGEKEPLKWNAASDESARTQVLTNAPVESGLTQVHLAVVYAADGTIAMYRNGLPYGAPYKPNSPLLTFRKANARVLIGSRNSGGDKPFFTGEIEEAALYDRALSAAEIAALAPPPEPEPSIARVWDEELLNAIRRDLPHPPVHARNLFTLSAAMFDSWAAYDPVATGFVYRRKWSASDPAAARREAISQAAYHILRERFARAVGADVTLNAVDLRLKSLGYAPVPESADPSTPAGLGRAVASAVSAWFMNDGSRQAQGYVDDPLSPDRYQLLNGYLDTDRTGTGGQLVDVNRWQPLHFTDVVPTGQNGTIILNRYQSFLGAPWLRVRPFATLRADLAVPGFDPGPPPLFGTASHDLFVSNVVAVIRASSELTTADGVMVDISPGTFGNNSLGANDGTGHPVNPVTGQPYAPNIVPRGDFARVLAEFWADGPSSETPPGHWNTLANAVSDALEGKLRIEGSGPSLDRLEWDVKLYFALNAAVHDAACAAWSVKRFYDGWRPLSAIRHLGSLGQSTDPGLPSFHAQGLPLIPDLIEVVTADTGRIGGRHAGLSAGTVAIRVWKGEGSHTVGWIRAVDWFPYQRRSFITPAFPGYVSGHSTFSRAAAEVLTAFTGSAFFPGGLGTYPPPNKPAYRLVTDPGPSQPVQLQWGTYFDAADQAGISRIWGGIHPPADDLAGRRIGAACGLAAWKLARCYFDGTVATLPVALAQPRVSAPTERISIPTIRGLYYRVQTSPRMDQPFADIPGSVFQALGSQQVIEVPLTEPGSGFFRVLQSDQP